MNTMTRSNHAGWTVLAGAVTALMLSVSTAAIAAPPGVDDTQSIAVSYAELDVSRPEGAKVLYQRIQRAALVVCNEYASPYRILRARASACYQDAVANAVAHVNSAQLYTIHREHLTRVASN
jgi:UrcA family protein